MIVIISLKLSIYILHVYGSDFITYGSDFITIINRNIVRIKFNVCIEPPGFIYLYSSLQVEFVVL